MIAPKFNFRLDTKAIEAKADALANAGGVMGVVLNEAKSDDGYYYWQIVNDGRPYTIYPKQAKALSWIDPATGKRIFSAKAKGFAPRHIRERALPVIRDRGQELARTMKIPFSIEGFTQFVLAWANAAVQCLQDTTPVVTGKLFQSYVIRVVRGE